MTQASASQTILEQLKAPLAKNAEPVRLGEAFRKYCYELDGEPTLVRWARAWWRYDGIRYVEHDEEMLDRDLIRFLDVVVVEKRDEEGKTKRERITARMKVVNEVRKALTHVMPMLGAGSPPQWTQATLLDPPPHKLVPCANGLLDLRTRELAQPTPRLFSTTAIGAPWDPEAPAPTNWFAFLESMWGSDRESMRALQQMFGYLLTPDTSQQKMFAMIGPSRSGKGTIMRVLKALLGDDAVVNPTLQSLERPFGLAPLVGKTVAIIGDARLGGKADQAQVVERLLSISGEDPLSIDRKNRDPINVRLRTRVVLVSNELPRLYDTSGALASRFLILQTTQSFLGREDHGLEAKLLAELPGIFRWAVEGYEDLQEAGKFLVPLASMEAISSLEETSAPLKVFLAERCEIATEARVDVEELYEAYKSWCKANGYDHPSNTQVFSRDLRTLHPDLKIGQRRKDTASGKRMVREFRGITAAGGWS